MALVAVITAGAVHPASAAPVLPVPVPLPDPPSPLIEERQAVPPVPDAETVTPPPPTTAPPTTRPPSPPEVSEPSPEPPTAGESTRTATSPTGRGKASGSARRPTARPSAAPASGPVPVAVVPAAAVEEEAAVARLRKATLPAASEFRFPLGLGLLVLAFLAVQSRLDKRDPKLAMAPVSVDDDLLQFL